jgi:hypothetical protein
MKKIRSLIEKCLVISTGHLSEQTLMALNARDLELPFRKCSHTYGWIFFLGEDAYDFVVGTPLEIVEIVELAQKNRCYMINLDADGEYLDGLKIFEHGKKLDS